MTIDLNKIEYIYFVGIKGVGMAALALIVHQMGKHVAGSDVDEIFITDEELKSINCRMYKGFDVDSIKNELKKYTADNALVITTTAHGGLDNPQCKWARDYGFTVLTEGEALEVITHNKKTIAISGTHGKTTTTALLSHVLKKCNKHPSYFIGTSEIASLGYGGAYDKKGEYFVVEADEYISNSLKGTIPKFLHLNPYVGVITSIDFDHPDVYTNLDEVIQAFYQFTKNIKSGGYLILNIDDLNIRRILNQVQDGDNDIRIITYGFSKKADYRIVDYKQTKKFTKFKISRRFGRDRQNFPFKLSIPGRHNALNAAAVISVCLQLGLSVKQIQNSITSFTGSKRRLEFIVDAKEIKLYDDYAHHPSEIRATLEAVKSLYPDKKIAVIFQAHTFSRTKALLLEFSTCFKMADTVGILDIFSSAREQDDHSISGALLSKEIGKHQSNVFYEPDTTKLIPLLLKVVGYNSVLITMGAGDVNNKHKDIIARLFDCSIVEKNQQKSRN